MEQEKKTEADARRAEYEQVLAASRDLRSQYDAAEAEASRARAALLDTAEGRRLLQLSERAGEAFSRFQAARLPLQKAWMAWHDAIVAEAGWPKSRGD